MFIPLRLSVVFFTWGLLSASHFALAGNQLRGMPDIPQCVVVALSWPSGAPPYDVTIEDQTHKNIFGTSVNHNSLRWTVTPSSGTEVKFASIDSNGATSFAGPYSVVEGSTDCLNSTSSGPTQKRHSFEIHLYFDKKRNKYPPTHRPLHH